MFKLNATLRLALLWITVSLGYVSCTDRYDGGGASGAGDSRRTSTVGGASTATNGAMRRAAVRAAH